MALAACGQGKKSEKFTALPFPAVNPPGMMTDSHDLAEYMVLNYWNGITDASREYPSDSNLVSGVLKSELEQKFADWISILEIVPRETADKAIAKLYDRSLVCEKKDTSSNVFETFVSLVDKYFYDPNSPFRNEDNYHVYAKRLASYEGYDEATRGKYEFHARITGLNKIGTKANDFKFTDKKGKIHYLYNIEAPLTLLFFSNPGCTACKGIIDVLGEEPMISDMIAKGRLAVLNIYIDEELSEWKEYMPIYPEEWYNGFDQDLVLRNNTIYNIRAIPSLYLLDAEKRVIMKDAPEDKIFEYLLNL